MHDILSDDELECWRAFVLASRLLSSPILSNENIMLADALLLSFCRRFEGLHGQSSITPNMHMHGHLTECIKDYGPLSSFWLFSFERFNGLLGYLPTNNRLIETQVKQRFVHDNPFTVTFLYSIEADEVNDMFEKVIVDHAHSFQSMKYQPSSKLGALSACTSGFQYSPARKYTLASLSSPQFSALLRLYCSLYESLSTSDVEAIPRTYKKMGSITINGQQINSGQYIFVLLGKRHRQCLLIHSIDQLRLITF